MINPTIKSFHRHNKSIICTLDHASLIEAFVLEGQMSIPLDIDELQGKFETNTHAYTGKAMLHHIPMDLKKVGDYPKVDKMMHVGKFKNYI